jgi:hypothetical protein
VNVASKFGGPCASAAAEGGLVRARRSRRDGEVRSHERRRSDWGAEARATARDIVPRGLIFISIIFRSRRDQSVLLCPSVGPGSCSSDFFWSYDLPRWWAEPIEVLLGPFQRLEPPISNFRALLDGGNVATATNHFLYDESDY